MRVFRLPALLAAVMLALPAHAAPAKHTPAAPKATGPKTTGPKITGPKITGNAWLNKIGVTPTGGHVLGNPAAEQKLVEYMSYTCSHCAHFEAESALPLRAGPLSEGKASFEVRHLLRDSIDVTVAMITNCVPPIRFFPLHHRFLAEQPQWFALAQKMTEEQMKRWNAGPMPLRMRAIASDLKFYDIAASAGLTRGQTDGCFANEAILRRLVAQTKEASTLGIDSTPSFLLNGTVLAAEHDWTSVKARLTPAP